MQAAARQVWLFGSGLLPALSAALCAGGLSLGAICVVAAHPRFGFGVWRDAEVVNSLFHLAAACCLGGLALHVGRSRTNWRDLCHPALAILAGLAIWSMVSAVFAPFPRSALLGPPQNAQGAFWFVALAAFFASALLLRRYPRLFSLLLMVAGLTGLAAALLNLRHAHWITTIWRDWLPHGTLHGFNEYLAYYGLPLCLLGLAARLRSKGLNLALLATGCFILAVSNNRTAWLALLIIMLTLWLCRRHGFGTSPWRWCSARPWRLLMAVLLAHSAISLLPLIAVHVAPETAGSLQSRQILHRVVLPVLADPPAALLLGHGWGEYASALLRHLPMTGIRFLQSEWIDFNRDQFHSHHAGLETLFAIGLPGLLLLILLPVGMVLGSRPALRPAAFALALALGLIDAMWFSMPETLALLALTLAALAPRPGNTCAPCSARPAYDKLAPVVLAASFDGLALLLVFTATWEWRYARGMEQLKSCLQRPAQQTACIRPTIPADPRGNGLVLAMLIEEAVAAMLPTPARPRWPARRVALLGTALQAAAAQCEAGCAPALLRAIANAHSALASAPATTASKAVFSPEAWRHALLQLLATAPERYDVALPYMNWLTLHSDTAGLRDFLARAPDSTHPIRSWFAGLVLLEAPQAAIQSRGLALMRHALADGIERFMPVDQTIKRDLGVSGMIGNGR